MAAAGPVEIVRADGAGFPTTSRDPQAASQTSNQGVLAVLSGGFIEESAQPITATIQGVTVERGQNLAAAGVPEEGGNEAGTPRNQPSARTTAVGSPVKDGKFGYYHADGKTTFKAALVDGQNGLDSDVSNTLRYAMARQANGYWAVDRTATGTTAIHVANIVRIDPINNEFVWIRFDKAVRAFD